MEISLRGLSAAVDSGGNHTSQVIAYCKPRLARRIFPIKGRAGPHKIWPVRSSRTHDGERVFVIGSDSGKEQIYARLRIEEPGAGYIHFPNEEWCDSAWFDQLTSETCETYRDKTGKSLRRWNLRPGKRNEVLDTFNYSLAARLSEPFRGMLAAPRTIYLDKEGKPLPPRHPVKDATPSSILDIDNPASIFVQPVKKKRTCRGIAGWNQNAQSNVGYRR